jgi:hypothetical protein
MTTDSDMQISTRHPSASKIATGILRVYGPSGLVTRPSVTRVSPSRPSADPRSGRYYRAAKGGAGGSVVMMRSTSRSYAASGVSGRSSATSRSGGLRPRRTRAGPRARMLGGAAQSGRRAVAVLGSSAGISSTSAGRTRSGSARQTRKRAQNIAGWSDRDFSFMPLPHPHVVLCPPPEPFRVVSLHSLLCDDLIR